MFKFSPLIFITRSFGKDEKQGWGITMSFHYSKNGHINNSIFLSRNRVDTHNSRCKENLHCNCNCIHCKCFGFSDFFYVSICGIKRTHIRRFIFRSSCRTSEFSFFYSRCRSFKDLFDWPTSTKLIELYRRTYFMFEKEEDLTTEEDEYVFINDYGYPCFSNKNLIYEIKIWIKTLNRENVTFDEIYKRSYPTYINNIISEELIWISSASDIFYED